MTGLPWPLTDARVELDWPFGFLPGLLRYPAGVAVFAGCIGLVVWLYRLELLRATPRMARWLLGLRTAAVGVVFVVATCAPVVVRTVSEPTPGRVVIAVDLSESMRVTDGVSPDTRVELARRLLTAEGADLLGRIGKSHAVDLIGFGQARIDLPADPDALAAALAAKAPGIAYTDLKLPLARVEGAYPDSPVIGVVILTDGRHNWGESPLGLARSLGARSIPVYPVNVVSRHSPPDVAVASAVPAVQTVWRGSSVPITARVRVTGMPGGAIPVELRFPEGKPALVQTVQHDGSDRTYEITFHPRLDRVGNQNLTIVANPGHPDVWPENNTRSVTVRVVDDKPRVLLIDGEARWDYRYLDAALRQSRDPELEVRTVLFRQPRVGKPSEAQADQLGLPALKLPEAEDGLAGFDCIVLGDVTADQLPHRERERLERHVADGGGTLIVVAGKRSIPVGLLETASEVDPIRKLLPVRNPRVLAPTEKGFRPEFTASGSGSWFLRLADDPNENAAVWDRLPALEWAVTGEAKDGAEVLAWVNDPRWSPSPSGGTPERQWALIARQNYGFGRVLYVGFDGSWRWRYRVGPDHHHRFWKQVVQWAAADRLLPVRNAGGTIRFGTRAATYQAGQDVELVLRAGDTLPALSLTATRSVRLIRLRAGSQESESVIGTYPLVVSDGRPRELALRIPNLPPGRYTAEPEIPGWVDQLRAPGGPLRADFEVRSPETEELTELTADVPMLESLASASGGEVFHLRNAGDLAELLAARSAVKVYQTSRPLNRSWWTLAAVALLLAAEWVLRKAAGLS